MLIWYQNNKQNREDLGLKPPPPPPSTTHISTVILIGTFYLNPLVIQTMKSAKSMENLSLNCNMYKPN